MITETYTYKFEEIIESIKKVDNAIEHLQNFDKNLSDYLKNQLN